MSFGKSKSKSSQQQSSSGTSTTTVDPWSKAQYENQTRGILDATLAYTQSDKPTTAGLSTTQQQARDLAQQNLGNWGGILDSATGAAQAGVNFDPADVSRYYNPYEQQVIDATNQLYDEQLARQINQQNDAVAMRGAFGNVSRDLGEAELRRGALLDRANAISNLKYQGYKDAVATGFQDAANKYQGAGILGSLAGQKQQLNQNDVAMLEQLGATEREIEQARITGDLNKLLLELQVRQGILGSTPMGQTTTQSGTGTSSGTSSSTNFGASLAFGPSGFSFGG